ncbi:DNA-binding protein [Thiovibrio sp. JS02]
MKLKKWQCVLGSVLCVLTLAACDSQQQTSKAPEPKTAQEAPGQEMQAPEKQIAYPLQGKAKEVAAGGGFTYILLASPAGEIWVAVPETEVKVDEEVTVNEGQLMQNFPSKSLNKTFAELIFAPGLAGKEAKGAGMNPHGTEAPAAQAMTPAAGGADFNAAMQQEAGAETTPAASEVAMGSSKAIVPFVELKMDKAKGENGYTVAELFAKATQLNAKKVKVKGQVVKVSAGIMGKTWLHLQDGSGDPVKNTHDLVVTTAASAEKGDIVTVEGVLAANKDFGFGYKYNVIVEDVTVTR